VPGQFMRSIRQTANAAPSFPAQTGQQELKMQVDVGGEVLCQAHVPDVSRVFISIGVCVGGGSQL